jgi:hypothetical protein
MNQAVKNKFMPLVSEHLEEMLNSIEDTHK